MGKISEAVRREIKGSGMSRYMISKKTGIPQSTLSRFLSGEGGLNLDTLDKLAALLGLRIVSKRKLRRS